MTTDAKREATPHLDFIRDEAADTDFFASPSEVGSHERVARAVASALAHSEDLKVIGLLGPWGSGKSTVVRLIEARLKAEEAPRKTHVFCFDAWLHQSDPLRRAFLETFIRFLIQEKLTTPARWANQLAELNRQVEQTETTSSPSLTLSGRVLLLFLLLVPFGLQFVGHDWFDAAYGDEPSVAAFWAFWLGVSTVPLAALAALVIYYRWRPVRLPWKSGFWTWRNWRDNRPPHEEDSLLALFINRQVERQKSRVVRTPDPTAIEFQRIFRDVIAETSKPDRRILLVIDNLDRLNEADAVALWGTVRSFFLGADEPRPDAPARLPTVILPVDQMALERMYRIEHPPEAARDLVRSFMDKTFNLTFHVTPPVLSDWHAYLADKMAKVFGEHLGQDWVFHVGRIYEKKLQGGGGVTPRSVNVTINAIAALWLQWRDQGVAFVTLAYYAVFRDEIDPNITGALEKTGIDISEFDPDWQRGLAALHFGRSPDVAIQILIEPRLRRAIETPNAEMFKAQSEIRGFGEVFQRILDASAPADLAFVSRAATLFAGLDASDAPWVGARWLTLRRLWLNSRPWGGLTRADPVGLAALLQHCPKDIGPTFIGRVARRLSQTSDDALMVKTSPQAFALMTRELIQAARAQGLEIPAVDVPGDVDVFLNVLSHAGADMDVIGALKTRESDAALLTRLSAIMQDHTVAAGSVAKTTAMHRRSPDADWSVVSDGATFMISNRQTAHPGFSTAVTVLGARFARNDADRRRVTDLASANLLHSRMSEALGEEALDLVAALAALMILSEVDLETPNGRPWTAVMTDFPKLVEQIDRYVVAYGREATLHLLVRVAQRPVSTDLGKALVAWRLRQAQWGNLFVEDIVADVSAYLDVMPEASHARFLNGFTTYRDFWQAVDQTEFGDSVQRLLSILSREDGEISRDIRAKARKTLKARLRAVSKAGWRSAVQGRSQPVPTALALAATQKATLNLGAALYDALEALRPELVSAESGDLARNWFEAAGWLSVSARRTLFANLRDHLFGLVDAPHLLALLEIGGPALLADGKFLEVADGAVRHVILPQVASAEGQAWLVQSREACRAWVAAANADTCAFLKATMRHRRTEEDKAGQARLDGLAAAWALGSISGGGMSKG